MARIILQNDNINIETSKKENLKTGIIGDSDILQKRSKKYLDLISSIDSKTLTSTKGIDDLLKAIKEELGTVGLVSLPLGIVSKCHLGHPYEVHTLYLCGRQYIEHFKINEKMEADFEKARTLAIHNAYEMVEVYKDKIILIREDGTITKL